MEKETVRFKHEIKKRTRHIFYEGSKYHRRCKWHGRPIYIVSFLGINKCQIELSDGSQLKVEVDDEKFDLKEYKS